MVRVRVGGLGCLLRESACVALRLLCRAQCLGARRELMLEIDLGG